MTSTIGLGTNASYSWDGTNTTIAFGNSSTTTVSSGNISTKLTSSTGTFQVLDNNNNSVFKVDNAGAYSQPSTILSRTDLLRSRRNIRSDGISFSTSSANTIVNNNTGGVVFVVGDIIYYCGGTIQGGSTDTNVYYSSVTTPTTWTLLSGSNVGGDITGAVGYVGFDGLYIYGGGTLNIRKASFSDLATWTVVGTMPGSGANRYASIINRLDGTPLLVGGYNGSTALSTTYVISKTAPAVLTASSPLQTTTSQTVTLYNVHPFVVNNVFVYMPGSITVNGAAVVDGTYFTAPLNNPVALTASAYKLPFTTSPTVYPIVTQELVFLLTSGSNTIYYSSKSLTSFIDARANLPIQITTSASILDINNELYIYGSLNSNLILSTATSAYTRVIGTIFPDEHVLTQPERNLAITKKLFLMNSYHEVPQLSTSEPFANPGNFTQSSTALPASFSSSTAVIVLGSNIYFFNCNDGTIHYIDIDTFKNTVNPNITLTQSGGFTTNSTPKIYYGTNAVYVYDNNTTRIIPYDFPASSITSVPTFPGGITISQYILTKAVVNGVITPIIMGGNTNYPIPNKKIYVINTETGVVTDSGVTLGGGAIDGFNIENRNAFVIGNNVYFLTIAVSNGGNLLPNTSAIQVYYFNINTPSIINLSNTGYSNYLFSYGAVVSGGFVLIGTGTGNGFMYNTKTSFLAAVASGPNPIVSTSIQNDGQTHGCRSVITFYNATATNDKVQVYIFDSERKRIYTFPTPLNADVAISYPPNLTILNDSLYPSIRVGSKSTILPTNTCLSSVGVGTNILTNATIGLYNVGLGSNILTSLTTGAGNIGIGNSGSIPSGVGPLGAITTGSYNIAIGHRAGEGIQTTSTSNLAIGDRSWNTLAIYNRSTALGYLSQPSAADQIKLGNSSTITLLGDGTAVTSDERDKYDIEDSNLGLDFILSLKPRTYKLDKRISYVEKEILENGNTNNLTINNIVKDGSLRRIRPHYGFVSQEVKQLLDDRGIDFAGYIDIAYNNGLDEKVLRYEEFISPIVKAIQELNDEVTRLKQLLPKDNI